MVTHPEALPRPDFPLLCLSSLTAHLNTLVRLFSLYGFFP